MSENDLQEQAQALYEAMVEEVAAESGYDREDLEGLSVQDLQAVREEALEIRAADLQERASARDAAIEAQAALEGMTADEYQRKVTLERAMQHARDTGNWSDYLRVKASDERNIDRTTEQGPGQHRVTPWWTARKEEQR